MKNIDFIKGNLFTTSMQTVVNTINCVGAMGAGVALDFKMRYPEMFRKYSTLCKEKQIHIGKLWIWSIPDSDKKVLNFPTKYHWKYPSKEVYLVRGLEKFIDTYQEKGIKSVAFPLLGAQNGGLNPVEVRELMVDYLGNVDIPVEIYQYNSEASDDLLPLLKQELLFGSFKQLKKESGLGKKAIENLQSAVAIEYVNSMIQLRKIKGIGEKTLAQAYAFAMKLKQEKSKPIQNELFSSEERRNSTQGSFHEPKSPARHLSTRQRIASLIDRMTDSEQKELLLSLEKR